ncbi:hypothetical protein ACTJLC_07330 [Paraburkholderia sp. 22099]|jgi:cell division septation protein DedD|uniref:Lipoprotein n=1 Tax=Paraburkholderia terricola TaxID=169427 RepID=A0A1M6SX60_9BURK|nr:MULTISPECIES: hypothetical protein [Paraburkholderia]MDR6493791.1 cell division septation protein DedD [Paraburkholderia terricola]SDO67442.1 hypothetical protein SAMN05192547_102335 [Paraburkholderia sediminicola]SHK49249.1 hypothetical protein SAMN05192548_102458 [Paraburkholderia terricola]
MSVVPKPSLAVYRKRLAGVLVTASLCALIGACGDEGRDPSQAGAARRSDNASADNSNTPAVLSADPSSASPAPAAVTIQSPALPASSADPALSAAASTPLAPPVIHTVD